MEKDFETEVLTRLAVIENKLDDYSRIRDKVEKSYTLSSNNDAKLKEIENKLRWISNTVVGAIITGIIGILFLFLKSGMGLK